MDSHVTHLAGPAIIVGTRKIQRCCLCGEKLLDSLYSAIVASSDGSVEFGEWPKGRLVRFSVGRNPRSEVLLPDSDGELPKDSCINLVE